MTRVRPEREIDKQLEYHKKLMLPKKGKGAVSMPDHRRSMERAWRGGGKLRD